MPKLQTLVEVERNVHRVLVEERGGRTLRRHIVDCPRGRSKDLNVCTRCPDCRSYTLLGHSGSTMVCTVWESEEVGGAPPGTVGAAMARDVTFLAPDVPLEQALGLLSQCGPCGVPVLDPSDRPVGLVPPQDPQRLRKAARRAPVRESMMPAPPTAKELEPLEPALQRMRQAGARCLVVVDDDGRAIGLVIAPP